MALTIKVNQLTLVHEGSDGFSRATLPDVCKTPPSSEPIEYPNVTYSKDLVGGSITVDADGGNMIAISGSEFTPSEGDEQGTDGGVKSGVNMKESTWITYSMDVKIEGRNACRLTDKKFHNRGNTVNAAGEMQNQLEKPPDCGPWEDGAVIGAGDPPCGCAEGDTPVTPPGCTSGATLKKIVYVNGMMNKAHHVCENMTLLAKKRCAAVVAVYNKSEGFFKDLMECIGDKLGIGDSPATDTLSGMIDESLANGTELEILGHSQGALITSRALFDARNANPALFAQNSSLITVNTIGGAAWFYPAGPSYTHTVNLFDFVPQLLGKGVGQIVGGAVLGREVGGEGGEAAGAALGAMSGLQNISTVLAAGHGFAKYMESFAQGKCQCAPGG